MFVWKLLVKAVLIAFKLLKFCSCFVFEIAIASVFVVFSVVLFISLSSVFVVDKSAKFVPFIIILSIISVFVLFNGNGIR